MADLKGTRSHAVRKSRSPFAQFKGKIIDTVEVHANDAQIVVGIMFDDRTYLSFDVGAAMTVSPEYSDFKTGNYKPLKRWRPIRT